MIAAVLMAGAFLAGILKVGFGQGSGILALPLYTLVVPPRFANGVLAPLLILGDLLSIRAYWRQWESRLLPILLPGQICGVVVGAYALAHLPEAVARRCIGLLLIAAVAAQFLARGGSAAGQAPPANPPARPGIAGALLTSLAAGFTSSLAQIGSSFLSVYLVRRRTAKQALVPTLNVTFFFSNLVKIGLYWRYGLITRATCVADAWLAPALLLGGLVGVSLNRRVSQRAFENVVLAFALLAGGKLLLG